jgi:hypothetical protein
MPEPHSRRRSPIGPHGHGTSHQFTTLVRVTIMAQMVRVVIG